MRGRAVESPPLWEHEAPPASKSRFRYSSLFLDRYSRVTTHLRPAPIHQLTQAHELLP